MDHHNLARLDSTKYLSSQKWRRSVASALMLHVSFLELPGELQHYTCILGEIQQRQSTQEVALALTDNGAGPPVKQLHV